MNISCQLRNLLIDQLDFQRTNFNNWTWIISDNGFLLQKEKKLLDSVANNAGQSGLWSIRLFGKTREGGGLRFKKEMILNSVNIDTA